MDAAIAKLREATNTLYHSAEPLPARMVKSLQAKVEAAKEELELLVEATMEDLEPPQLEAAVAAIASAMPSVDELKEKKVEVPKKKEAFVNGLSIGTCKNDKCLCADCECGASCQCNTGGAFTGVEQDGTCEPCGSFRSEKAAEKMAQQQKKQKQ